MTLTNELAIIESLDHISDQLNRYLSPMIFVFGTVGNIINCLVLSQRGLRTNPCAFLFLISSFVDLISIVVGLTTRIMAGWNSDPTAIIDWVCKFRVFVVFSTRTLATWLITLATIDRWLLSSLDNHRRQMSTLRNAKIGTIICSIFSIVSYIHMTFCYQANLQDQPLQCYGGTAQCRLATDLIYILITVVTPLVLMLAFGLLTISNIRHVRTRVHAGHRETSTNGHAGVGQKERQSKRTDRHLLRMLIVQVIFMIIFCLPQAIQKIHITFSPFGSGSLLEDAIKKFLYNLEVLLAFVASGMPFYIYTLAGGVIFRKGLMDLLNSIKHRLSLCSR